MCASLGLITVSDALAYRKEESVYVQAISAFLFLVIPSALLKGILVMDESIPVFFNDAELYDISLPSFITRFKLLFLSKLKKEEFTTTRG